MPCPVCNSEPVSVDEVSVATRKNKYVPTVEYRYTCPEGHTWQSPEKPKPVAKRVRFSREPKPESKPEFSTEQ